MKLYYAPGACSLASRISLHEAGLAADFVRVDLKAKITEYGDDYRALNPKGSVPMLVLDDWTQVTENVAILELIADREPRLGPGGPLARTRLLEMLSYLSSELHIGFKPFWHDPSEADKARAGETVARHLAFLESQKRDLYMFGPDFTVADAYLFVMLRWAKGFGLPISPRLKGYFERVMERSTIRQALAEEAPTETAPIEATLIAVPT
jgi:glutathione S-transferase